MPMSAIGKNADIQAAGSLPSPRCSFPSRTVNHRGALLRRSTKCHCGCPSVVENDRNLIPSTVVMATSGDAPNSSHRAIRPSRNVLNAGSHRSSSLQLPHRIATASSMRQLHSTPSDTSPSGLPGEPSRLATGCNLPHSMKMAEP